MTDGGTIHAGATYRGWCDALERTFHVEGLNRGGCNAAEAYLPP
ncbi:MAG: hypothetical protein ACI3ZP_10740 [Candidatus Cryptobacteroides sp.]